MTGPVRKALFDAGYASRGKLHRLREADLYVAVTSESHQAGQLRDGTAPRGQPGWQAMAARLGYHREGKALYSGEDVISPVFAQLFARLGRHLNYRDKRSAPNFTCGPPPTTCSRRSAPAPRATPPAPPGSPAPAT